MTNIKDFGEEIEEISGSGHRDIFPGGLFWSRKRGKKVGEMEQGKGIT